MTNNKLTMKGPKAFLFDMNGTMIDDMRYHLDVWYDVIVNDLGANLTKEEVRGHMYGKNSASQSFAGLIRFAQDSRRKAN